MSSLGQHRSNYDPVLLGSTRRSRSTSQTCLHKILTIITTVPPPLSAATPPFSGSETNESSPENDASGENKGSGFDSRVELCVPDAAASEGGGCAAAHGGGYCEANLRVPEDSRVKIEEEGDDERSLIMLIEAAKLIFGDDFEDDGKHDPGELKKDEAAAADIHEPKLRRRSSCWTAAEMGGGFEETTSSPVVRSKRGRTTVLPLKYRDSVLEPLTRLSRPGPSIFPSKRRRR